MIEQLFTSRPRRRQKPLCGVWYRLHGWLCVLPLLCCAGCFDSLPGKPTEAERYRRPNTIMDFATLYKTHCSGCHGANGDWGPAPPLNDPMFLAICSDEELKKILTYGRPGTPMPAIAKQHGGALTDAQIDSLIAGIRKTWGKEVTPSDPPIPKYLPPEAAGNVEAGKDLFASHCAGCHGNAGRGGDMAGALNDSGFLGTVSDQLLRRIIITGRPDLGMPNYRDAGSKPLTSEEIADLVALLASWRTADEGLTNETDAARTSE